MGGDVSKVWVRTGCKKSADNRGNCVQERDGEAEFGRTLLEAGTAWSLSSLRSIPSP